MFDLFWGFCAHVFCFLFALSKDGGTYANASVAAGETTQA